MWRAFWINSQARSLDYGSHMWKAARKAGVTVTIILAYTDREACVTTFDTESERAGPDRVPVGNIPLSVEDMARGTWMPDPKLLEKQALSPERTDKKERRKKS